ncbi:hypothetical protein Cal7507_1889 [Calothrix sp. PCC 7507]|nr:hypothetical protein Cal7507_1889 [Calothrix sp. PCC 7507]
MRSRNLAVVVWYKPSGIVGDFFCPAFLLPDPNGFYGKNVTSDCMKVASSGESYLYRIKDEAITGVISHQYAFLILH